MIKIEKEKLKKVHIANQTGRECDGEHEIGEEELHELSKDYIHNAEEVCCRDDVSIVLLTMNYAKWTIRLIE